MASEVAREDKIGFGWKIGIFAGLAATALVWAPFWGVEPIPFGTLWGDANEPYLVEILWRLRIPRVLVAFLAGSALSTCGMALQALVRNRFASPYTLGISSGAALGASVAVQLGWTAAAIGISGVSAAAITGAAVSIGAVYLITSRSGQGSSAVTTLLAGAALGLSCSAAILLLLCMTDFAGSFRMIRWTLGGLEPTVGFRDLLGMTPLVVSGCLIVWYLLHELNLLAAGDDFAFSRGMNVRRTKLVLLACIAAMVGGVVAVCGPIGFVGLVAPHVCRKIVGADHRRLFPAAWLFGGTLLVICDTAARTLTSGAELPVGIITALLGSPFFVWLLVSREEP